ncbi:transcriptional regulator, PadR family [Quadrisphaera granulorum]|uniref:PadR family transcriptional regulator n=1 Tax=Quadrisphaera granulorum TaxID=317664 RepID=A0A316ADT6_9ACTN|nr:PadR family transcriptional regulator [Quadrisphaera granulorum]PWJ55781.1 PadR family transcriptional regulator [Quadrisphaera granulorum]SZE95278.1 transcriptional regulator, PadR family [Quadrisphaera granulorum]
MARGSDALTIAVLGLLDDTPLHGYELRKRIDLVIGPLRRRISFGSLYPALRSLEERGWITQSSPTTATPPLAGKRSRVVYQLTDAGRAQLRSLLANSGPATWEDEQFDVHFAFFGSTDPTTRLRILEGRRTRVVERLERVCDARASTRSDSWSAELHRHTTDSLERELRWLDELVERERTSGPGSGAPPRPPETPPSSPAAPPGAGREEQASTTSQPFGQLSSNQ